MITQEQQKQGAELMKTLVEKAWKDINFKDQLVVDPKTTIETILGKSLSIAKNIIVEDQSNPNFIYLNIPVKPNFSDIELSDEQLEAVSGGEIGLTGWILIGAAVLIVGGAAGYATGEAVK